MEPLRRNAVKGVLKEQDLALANQATQSPSLPEIKELIRKFAPTLIFHPDQSFVPVEVDTYLQNAWLVNAVSKTKTPVTGKKLFEAALSSEQHYFETINKNARQPNEQGSTAYVHVNPVDAEFTDLQYWFLFEQTGAASAHVKWLIDQTIKGYEGKISLNPLGSYCGNWKTVIVRVNHNTGEAEKVFLSQDAGGKWVHPGKFQKTGQQCQIYVSKNNHNFYQEAGFHDCKKVRFNSYSSVLEFFIQDETANGISSDYSESWELISAEHLGKEKPMEPSWLNFQHHWSNPNPDYLTVPALKRMIPSAFGKSLDFLLSKELLDEVVNYLLFYFKEVCADKTIAPKSSMYWRSEAI